MEGTTTTPLINSTSRPDVLSNTNTNIPIPDPKQKQNNSHINSPLFDDSSLSNLTITSGKLRDLEADIATEASELGTLKEAIKKSELLSHRISRILTAYENRMADLERVVMPVYRNILNMSQVNDRIEGTICLVEHLMKVNEQVRKEVVICLPGPMPDNLLVYLDSINRLEAIQQDLSHSDLSGNCKISLERTTVALEDARSKLQQAFRNWLTNISERKDEENSPGIVSDHDEKIPVALQTVVNFYLNSSANFSALISDWIEIRSNFLAASCESLFMQSQAFEKDPSGYQPGSHPLPLAFSHARSLLHSEELFMAKVWPSSAIGPTFLQSAQIVRDLALSTVECITGKMKKALARREYADQVFLFNVLGASYTETCKDHHELESESQSQPQSDSESSLSIQVLLPSLKYFVTTTASLLTDLIGEIRGTIPRAIERPFPVPQNATVYELTSLTVNVLKRIERDTNVVEAILRGQSSENWDGTLQLQLKDAVNSTNSLTYTQRFFSDVLGSLESSIDAKSKTLRRPMQTLLFQINNYNYLAKGLAQVEMIDPALLKRYEQIIETLKRSFFNSWTMIANLITAESTNTNISTGTSTPSSAKISPKDRLKAFTLEFDDTLKVQHACAVPDLDLRTEFKIKIKEIIMTGYILFYNQHQLLFTSSSSASASSKYHDPDQIEDSILHLFEG